MRIVYLAWNGMTHTKRWAADFAEMGHDVHLITCGDGDARDEDDNGRPADPPYVIHDLGLPRAGKAGYLAKAPAARRLVRRLRPDLLHAHTATSYGVLGLASGFHPLVVTSHGSDLLLSARNPVLRPLIGAVLRAADLVTVPGEHVRTVALELGVDPDRLLTFQYGVETERLRALGAERRAARPSEAPWTIVSARPLTSLYRNEVLVEAMTERDDWRLEIAGVGPERAPLERLAGRLGVSDRVTFHGPLGSPAAERLIAGADVYASVADSDGTSIALLEALAAGTIPVVRDHPANRPWVEHAVTGFLVPADVAAVKAALEAVPSLDREQARETSFELVSRRGDRERNLGLLDERLRALVEGEVVRPT
jgi:glycosyltransferase involved in cell wall biosynthesis